MLFTSSNIALCPELLFLLVSGVFAWMPLKGGNIKEMTSHLCVDPCETDHSSKFLIVACLWYTIWCLRNEFLFQGVCNLQMAICKLESSVLEFAGAAVRGLTPSNPVSPNIQWRPPSFGRLSINVDTFGGGESAWAMVVRNYIGKLVFLASRWGKDLPFFPFRWLNAKAWFGLLAWRLSLDGQR